MIASSPITSWQMEEGKVEAETNFLLLGSNITADVDCSHEIRRWFLPGIKAMTILDSVLKYKYITLLTKVCIVKAVIFAVVMYEYQSWTTSKAEHQRIDAFKLWCWRRLLRVPSKIRRSNQSILMEINPKYLLEGLMLKLKHQYLGYLMRTANSLEKILMLGETEGKRRRGWQSMRWLDGIISSMDMNLDKLQEMVREQGGLVRHSPWGHKELDTTWQLNTNTHSPGTVGTTEVNWMCSRHCQLESTVHV